MIDAIDETYNVGWLALGQWSDDVIHGTVTPVGVAEVAAP